MRATLRFGYHIKEGPLRLRVKQDAPFPLCQQGDAADIVQLRFKA
jgi:hypothetical protein